MKFLIFVVIYLAKVEQKNNPYQNRLFAHALCYGTKKFSWYIHLKCVSRMYVSWVVMGVVFSQATFTCSRSTIETQERCVNSVQI